LKKYILYVFLIFLSHTTFAQYYLRGDIRDEKKQTLNGAKIFVHSTKQIYFSGAYGSFGITTQKLYDTLTVSLNGYDQKIVPVKSDEWQNVLLHQNTFAKNGTPTYLSNVTKAMGEQPTFSINTGDESYFQLIENNFIDCKSYPSTGYSIGVNKSSYSNVRRFINMGSEVPPDAVKIEEMINYFNLGYEEPGANEYFTKKSVLSDCPWSESDKLLYVNVSAKKLNLDLLAPGNFVFLIDVSGSMDMPNRLPLVQAAFQMFVKNLRPKDRVSIVVYGGSVGVYLQPTSGDKKDVILTAIGELTASGDTPGESAIRTAYKLAESTFIKGGNNRIILATDGDFNVGEKSEKALEDLVISQKNMGIYLTCLGVGMGNLKDSKLQALARVGNGNYAYLDDVQEAEKVLVKELTQTLYAVADDVLLEVDFNNKFVQEYRLIGFDNRKQAVTQSGGTLEGGEVGSGSNTLAIFQIKPTETLTKCLASGVEEKIATSLLTYKPCGATRIDSVRQDINARYIRQTDLSKDLKLATAVSMLGMELRKSKHKGSISWPMIQSYTSTAVDESVFIQKQFSQMISKAYKIYEPSKKKKLRLKL
jgi:Ca-activated chloride channel family protein